MSDKQLAKELGQCQLLDVVEKDIEELPLTDILESNEDVMKQMVEAIMDGNEGIARKLLHERLKRELRNKIPPTMQMVTK